jgi:hypothetical protein
MNQAEGEKIPELTQTESGFPSLIDMCANLVGNKEYADTYFVVLSGDRSGEKTPAISYFLKGRSKVFKAALEGKFEESSSKTISLECNQEVLDSFLYHLYTFDCKLPKFQGSELDDLEQYILHDLAVQHVFPILVKFGVNYILSLLNDENLQEMYDIALKYGVDDVRIHITNLWISKNPWIIHTKEALSIPLHLFRDFVASDRIGGDAELSILNAVEVYASQNQMKLDAKDVWKALLPFMTMREITTSVVEKNILAKVELLDLLLEVGSNGLTRKTRFSGAPRSRPNLLIDKSRSDYYVDQFLEFINMSPSMRDSILILGHPLLAGYLYTWTIDMILLSGCNAYSHIFGVAKATHGNDKPLGDINGWGYCLNGQRRHYGMSVD